MLMFCGGCIVGFGVGIGLGAVVIIAIGYEARRKISDALSMAERMADRVQYAEKDSEYWRNQCDEVLEELDSLK